MSGRRTPLGQRDALSSYEDQQSAGLGDAVGQGPHRHVGARRPRPARPTPSRRRQETRRGHLGGGDGGAGPARASWKLHMPSGRCFIRRLFTGGHAGFPRPAIDRRWSPCFAAPDYGGSRRPAGFRRARRAPSCGWAEHVDPVGRTLSEYALPEETPGLRPVHDLCGGSGGGVARGAAPYPTVGRSRGRPGCVERPVPRTRAQSGPAR